MGDRVYESTCGALAELVAHGVRTAVVSPGSRSTPLTVAAGWTSRLDVVVHLDERSAGFHALGIAKATRAPVVLICTSGTAAANYLPAVIEAHYTGVPLIVCTADRPPELREWGAGQTIQQVGLYGGHVRWSVELAVAGDVEPMWFRRMAARAVAEATSPRPGPVHLNWPFREPLEPTDRPDVSTEPTIARSTAARHPSPADRALVAQLATSERGLIVAGPGDADRDTVAAVAAFARATGWPVVAEPASGLRFGAHVADTPVIATADQLCRHRDWADQHVPEVVVRIGDSPTCKPLRLWLEARPPHHHLLVDPGGRWNEASFTATARIEADLAPLLAGVTARPSGPTAWTRSWIDADRRAASAIDDVLGDEPLHEPLLARRLAAALGSDAALYVSNSMPVRDLDGFAAAAEQGPTVYANRGASGIDGVVSSAHGVATTGVPTVLFIGDIALLHDASGLLHAARHTDPLTIVAADNDGGGIFSFLPIAGVDGVAFERLFHTPHGTDLAQFGRLDGVAYHRCTSAGALDVALDEAVHRPGLDLVHVPVDRHADLEQHRAVTAAVGEALG